MGPEEQIPATHDSGASLAGGDAVLTQSLSLANQLNSGIRGWDIRRPPPAGLGASSCVPPTEVPSCVAAPATTDVAPERQAPFRHGFQMTAVATVTSSSLVNPARLSTARDLFVASVRNASSAASRSSAPAPSSACSRLVRSSAIMVRTSA